jgi:DNA-binding IclR family transcriptional regulator
VPTRPEPGPQPAAPTEAGRAGGPGWTLLTSHGRVLLLIARDPDLRLRDIAERAQITERSAAGIVHDLEQAGYLTKVRVGRRNRYTVHDDLAFRHPAEAQHQVRELIEIFTG